MGFRVCSSLLFVLYEAGRFSAMMMGRLGSRLVVRSNRWALNP